MPPVVAGDITTRDLKMKKTRVVKWILVLALGGAAQARSIYVDKGSMNPTSPYTNGTTAAHTIQVALDVAEDGDEVRLKADTYTPSAELVITNAIYLRGPLLDLEHAKYTVISGEGNHRVLNLGTNACQVVGLTIKNGNGSDGGGIYCANNTPLVWNCVIDQNSGGSGGGMYRGTANGCIFTNNSGYYGGATRDTVLEYSTVVDNKANNCGGVYGGAAYKCKILNNHGTYAAGGVYNSSITNCTVIGNVSPSTGGGMSGGSAIGSVIAGNHAGTEGGGSYNSTLIHCTVTGNSAFTKGGGVNRGTVKNSIVWNNTASEGNNILYSQVYASCSPDLTAGENGNITDDPQLVSISHLGTGSPCMNAGDAAYSVGWDIDGQSWDTPPSMGCDERYATVTGDMTPFNNLPERIVTGQEIHFQAWVDGATTMTTLDFGDGTTLTNFTETTLTHTWTNGNYNVILTGFNSEAPYRTSITNVVYARTDGITTIYVSDATGNDSNDGQSWATAKKTIQAGANVQDFVGGLVLVSNGTYSITAELFVDKPIRIQGLDGAGNSIVKGNNNQRCFNLQNSFCILKDLTIRDGGGYAQGTSGGGAIYCSGPNPLVDGCIITQNNTSNGGGAMWRGTATNSTFIANTGGNGPAGMQAGIAIDCLFEHNVSGNGAGGIQESIATRCIFKENEGTVGGGARDSQLSDCQLLFNTSDNNGGGMYGGTAGNCVFRGNKSPQSGGGTYSTIATHCTYTANTAAQAGGGSSGGTLDHCILWYNSTMNGAENVSGGSVSYSCAPELEHGSDGNITNNPQLVSASHISPDSPCAGSGTIPRDTFDIDGENWRSAPAMGCDEPRIPYSTANVSITIDGPTDIPAGYKAFFSVDIQGAFHHDYVEFGDGQTAINTAIVPIYHTWITPGTYDMVISTYDQNNQLLVAVTNTITVRASDFNAIYVATNGNDSADGRSWANAKQTIQAGIDAQEFPGGQVVVSNGVYTLTETVKIDKGIQLIGLNGATNTIIDAVNLYGLNYQHSRGMEIGDVHCTVDGFTLQNANFSWTGGGIFCDYTTAPIISNCWIIDNKSGTAGGAYGGTFIDCTFSNNTASAGAAGGLHSGKAIRCSFTGNYSRDGGGGMYAGIATDCTFSKNESNGSGAGMYKGEANDCIFIENESYYGGGGMADGIANDCTFIKNQTEFSGGGMSGGTANRCAFIQNRSINYTGGGMNSGTANSCYFTGNRANTDGGATSYTTLNNCTVTGNSAGTKAGGCYSGYANNSIVWNNTAEESDNDLFSANPKFTCSPDAPHGTDGCITNNPQLVSASHIASTSPCIGVGRAEYATETDIDGEAWNNPPAMGCDEIGATLSGPIEMAFYGPSPIRSSTAGDYIAIFDGQLSKTIVDFGHGTPLTNAIGTLNHRWPGPAAQNYDVVLTAFNDDYPLGTSFTQTVEVVDSTADLHVRYDGYDGNDGLSWTNAKQTIQAAIDAQNTYNGKILVDGSLYLIGKTITVDKPIQLIGTDSGDTYGGGNIAIVDAGSSNRCFDITSSEVTIENFTIQNGMMGLQSNNDNAGAGIRCKTTDPRIYNCTLKNCTAYYGGAIQKGSLVYCSLSNNVAIQGGAVYQSKLDDCTVSSNSATSGGALYKSSFATGCTLSNNYASSLGGGAYNSTLTNCTLAANQADSQGGGAYNCTLDFCTITSNAAPSAGGAFGGTADRCRFTTNNASVTDGGGMYSGSAHNCTFHFNRAEEKGGATYSTTLRNCTVVENGAFDTGGAYGGYIYNSIIWDNFAWSNALNVAGTTPLYSCYPEADPSDSYHHNITNNPLFVAYAPGMFFRGSDYYLSSLSPCLNVGNNSYVETDRDFNGWDRILYGTVDMGANEMYFFASDTDGDGMPDGWELENFGGSTNAVASEDADSDTFDNLSEYVAGTLPHDDTSYLHIVQSSFMPDENDPSITSIHLEWSPSVEGRIYGISWSTNLVDGFQDRGDSFPYPADNITIGNDLPNAFYKINVRLDN